MRKTWQWHWLCIQIANAPYSFVPGTDTSRSANSRWIVQVIVPAGAPGPANWSGWAWRHCRASWPRT